MAKLTECFTVSAENLTDRLDVGFQNPNYFKTYEKLMPRCVKLADRVNELEEQLKLYNNEWADLALDILKLPNNGWHKEWRTCLCILCAYRKAIAEKQEKVEKKLKEQKDG